MPREIFERPDLDDDQLMKLINQIQNKINQVHKLKNLYHINKRAHLYLLEIFLHGEFKINSHN